MKNPNKTIRKTVIRLNRNLTKPKTLTDDSESILSNRGFDRIDNFGLPPTEADRLSTL